MEHHSFVPVGFGTHIGPTEHENALVWTAGYGGTFLRSDVIQNAVMLE